MKNNLFPSVKEAVLVMVITALFLTLTAVCIGLRPEHFLMVGVFLVLFFAGQTTRKLAVALLPFFIFGISYDWMRVYPNYQVNPIDVKGLYEAEKSLFGLFVDGAVLIPCEYFALNHCPVADFFAGVFYLCWVPVPIVFGLWLYLKGDRKVYLRFAMVFLLVNLIGFAGYYIHPAAPPWYARIMVLSRYSTLLAMWQAWGALTNCWDAPSLIPSTAGMPMYLQRCLRSMPPIWWWPWPTPSWTVARSG